MPGPTLTPSWVLAAPNLPAAHQDPPTWSSWHHWWCGAGLPRHPELTVGCRACSDGHQLHSPSLGAVNSASWGCSFPPGASPSPRGAGRPRGAARWREGLGMAHPKWAPGAGGCTEGICSAGGKAELGMGRERLEGSQGRSGVQCWPMGCFAALEGSRAPRCSHRSRMLGQLRSLFMGACWGGTPDPAWGEHPSPSSVLLLEPPLHLVGTGDAQSQLSRTSPCFLGPLTLVSGWI